MRPLLATSIALLLAAPAIARDTHVPEATPTGPAVQCLNSSQIRETRVRSDQVIDFIMNDRSVYRNTLPQSCPELGFQRRFLHETSINQYCAVDTITVLTDPGVTRGATCGLGNFQPVKLVGGTH